MRHKLHKTIDKAAPDVKLIAMVPLIREVLFKSLVSQLCHIINQWIHQAEHHDKVEQVQLIRLIVKMLVLQEA